MSSSVASVTPPRPSVSIIPQREAQREAQHSVSTSSATVQSGVLWEERVEKSGEKNSPRGNGRWYAALGGVVLLSGAGFLLARGRADDISSEADQYAIIEEVIEGGDDDLRT